MPYQPSFFQLPSGARCARVVWEATMTGEDASALMAAVEPGGQMHGLPLLALGQKLRTLTPEARAVFSSARAATFNKGLALVMPNPVIRVAANFVLRVNRNRWQRVFATEEEAIRWLEERIRESASKAEPGTP